MIFVLGIKLGIGWGKDILGFAPLLALTLLARISFSSNKFLVFYTKLLWIRSNSWRPAWSAERAILSVIRQTVTSPMVWTRTTQQVTQAAWNGQAPRTTCTSCTNYTNCTSCTTWAAWSKGRESYRLSRQVVTAPLGLINKTDTARPVAWLFEDSVKTSRSVQMKKEQAFRVYWQEQKLITKQGQMISDCKPLSLEQ